MPTGNAIRRKLLPHVKGALQDIAETVKCAIKGPKVNRAHQFFIMNRAECKSMEEPSAAVSSAALFSQPAANSAPLFASAPALAPNIKFEALMRRDACSPFKARTKSHDALFCWQCAAMSADIPKMKAPAANKIDESTFGFYIGTKAIAEFDILAKKTYEFATFFAAPGCHRSVERALAAPITIKSKDISNVPKAMWMRHTLHLVKETGENVKNIQIIGLYKIPKNGVKKIGHSASSGSVYVHVGADAIDSKRCTLVVARKKSDNTIISYITDIE
jgi:hypothetical protein